MKVTATRAKETWDAMRVPLDAFMRDVATALNGGLLVRENTACEIKEIAYTQGETLSVKTKYGIHPLEVRCLRARRSDIEGASVSGAAVTWSYANGFVTISSISGLTASAAYKVTLAVVEG